MNKVKMPGSFAIIFMALLISLTGCGGSSSSSSGGAPSADTGGGGGNPGPGGGTGGEDDDDNDEDKEPGDDQPGGGTGALLTFTGGFSSLTNHYAYDTDASFLHSPGASYLAHGEWVAGPGEDRLIVQYSEVYTVTTYPIVLKVYAQGGAGKLDINANPFPEEHAYETCMIENYDPSHPDVEYCTTWGIAVDRAGGTITFNNTPLYGFNGSGRTGTLSGKLHFPYMSP